MSDTERTEHPMTRQHAVLTLPGMHAVAVRTGVRYRDADGTALGMDLYYPPDAGTAPLPAVVFVSGYGDAGAEQMLGRKLKDWEIYRDWARLVACAGLVAITYENANPAEDAAHVVEYVRAQASTLGIDPERIGLWSASGNVPNALALLVRSAEIRCAALLYGYTLDLEGGTAVAEAARRWGFVDAMAGRPLEALPSVPLLLVRAGRDDLPGINETMDRFVASALRRGLPVTLVSHADAPHAFDISDDTESSRAVMRQVLGFLRSHLLGQL
jgi:dienelactone hydrolase